VSIVLAESRAFSRRAEERHQAEIIPIEFENRIPLFSGSPNTIGAIAGSSCGEQATHISS
jgi:hypothetical protein